MPAGQTQRGATTWRTRVHPRSDEVKYFCYGPHTLHFVRPYNDESLGGVADSGFRGGQGRTMGGYVAGTGTRRGATAAGGC